MRLALRTLVTRLLVPSEWKTSSVLNSVPRRLRRFHRVVASSTGGAGLLMGGTTLWLMGFLLSSRLVPYLPASSRLDPRRSHLLPTSAPCERPLQTVRSSLHSMDLLSEVLQPCKVTLAVPQSWEVG